MFAYSYKKYGAPDVLEKVQLPMPRPKSKEVLVRVCATTVSTGDWRARSLVMPQGLGLMGRLFFGITGPRKQILGTEFSGVIEAVGTAVKNHKEGDAVVGFPGVQFGAHAEFIRMPAEGKVTLKPENVTFDQAAAIPFGGTTAYDFLVNKAQLRKGESVLINGASGSVGSACVQIAKHLGAHVVGVCSGENVALVRSLGADRVIDYLKQGVVEEGVEYDMVIDTVATLPWSKARYCIRRGGKMVLIAGNTSDMLFGSIKACIAGKRMVGGVASESKEVLDAVVNLAEQGVLKPVIDSRYGFDDMRAAHARVDTGRKRGNVVVIVDAGCHLRAQNHDAVQTREPTDA